jgi:hypothetical protein
LTHGAATYFNALAAVPANVPLLTRLARNTGSSLTPAHAALERTIVEWRYIGIYTAAGRSQPYPLPPIPLSYGDQRVAAALVRTPYRLPRRGELQRSGEA